MNLGFSKYLEERQKRSFLVIERAMEQNSDGAIGDIDDLEMFIDNTEELYKYKSKIEKQSYNRFKLGKYNSMDMKRVWSKLVDRASHFYAMEFGSSKVFSNEVRQQLVNNFEKFMRGELDSDSPDIQHYK